MAWVFFSLLCVRGGCGGVSKGTIITTIIIRRLKRSKWSFKRVGEWWIMGCRWTLYSYSRIGRNQQGIYEMWSEKFDYFKLFRLILLFWFSCADQCQRRKEMESTNKWDNECMRHMVCSEDGAPCNTDAPQYASGGTFLEEGVRWIVFTKECATARASKDKHAHFVRRKVFVGRQVVLYHRRNEARNVLFGGLFCKFAPKPTCSRIYQLKMCVRLER